MLSIVTMSLLLVVSASVASGKPLQVKKLPSLHWSADNQLFAPPSESAVYTSAYNANNNNNYYLKLSAHLGDNIDLVCGHSDPRTAHSLIYKVSSKHEFDNCLVDPQNVDTVPILKCGQAADTKFTIYFVKFSPVPNALEFEEDREYYFLSTSSGAPQGLSHMAGGLCSNFNMRFSIKIESSATSYSSASFAALSTKLTSYYLLKSGAHEAANSRRNDDEADERLTDSQPQVSAKINAPASAAGAPSVLSSGVVWLLVACLVGSRWRVY